MAFKKSSYILATFFSLYLGIQAFSKSVMINYGSTLPYRTMRFWQGVYKHTHTHLCVKINFHKHICLYVFMKIYTLYIFTVMSWFHEDFRGFSYLHQLQVTYRIIIIGSVLVNMECDVYITNHTLLTTGSYTMTQQGAMIMISP